jgi:hypothetical protein
MLRAEVYPITVAELGSYSIDADEVFEVEEHERLKEFLALHPEHGDVLAGTDGVRRLRWPIKSQKGVPNMRIIYFFRDLNMPLYLLCLYRRGERIPLGGVWRAEIRILVRELIAQHSKGWARVIKRQDNGA